MTFFFLVILTFCVSVLIIRCSLINGVLNSFTYLELPFSNFEIPELVLKVVKGICSTVLTSPTTDVLNLIYRLARFSYGFSCTIRVNLAFTKLGDGSMPAVVTISPVVNASIILIDFVIFFYCVIKDPNIVF